MSRELFDSDADYKKQLFKELIEIVTELKWQIAIPKTKDEDDEVPGLIIGQSQYVNSVTEVLEDADFEF